MYEKKAKSISEFLSLCSELVTQWSSPESGEARLWYRGQKQAQWGLIPGEYRFPLINANELRSEFMLRAPPLLNKEPHSDWEWYFLMQHYGLSTRLLDWTEGSLIGLHFALCQGTGLADAAVWVIDPWALNKWSFGKTELVITGGAFKSDQIASKYLQPVYETIVLPRRPIAIVPPYNSPRITAQRGTFTIHGKVTKGLEVQFSKRLMKIVIPKDRAVIMRRELRSVGVSEFTLFPELDGLCSDIRAREIEGY
jgi:hypothetical protein